MIRVGLHGLNGHQIHHALVAHPHAKLVAVADIPRDKLAPSQIADTSIRVHATFDELKETQNA